MRKTRIHFEIKVKKYRHCSAGWSEFSALDFNYEESIVTSRDKSWRCAGYMGKLVQENSLNYIWLTKGWEFLERWIDDRPSNFIHIGDAFHESHLFVARGWSWFCINANESGSILTMAKLAIPSPLKILPRRCNAVFPDK